MKALFKENIKFIIVLLSIPIWLNMGMCCAGLAHADHQPKYKIAIIDTGYDALLVHGPKLKLCKYGHFNFANGKNEIGNVSPHGTYVASIIAKELENVDYCAVIYNVVMSYGLEIPTENVISAFYKASYEDVNAINASYDGNIRSVAERESVRDAAKRVSRIFVAAGNNNLNLDIDCLAFPACFDVPNMFPVGAMKADGSARLSSSNYGSRIKLWFNGVYSDTHKGTSFAAPRALASYILSLLKTVNK